MPYSRSPESPNRKFRKIDLPKEIKVFFGQRRKFIRGLPSYEQIEGINPENHEKCFDNTYGFPIPLVETHPVNNQEKEMYESAQKKTRELIHLFFGVPNSEIAEPLREYMLTGGTKPIRISTHISDEGRRVYVKLPSVERIMGLSLYNLISGRKHLDFLFSEYVFVEDSVQGRHMNEKNIGYFKRLPKLGQSIIESKIQDKFLGINDLDREVDLLNSPGNLVNLLIQADGEVSLFDVDCAFMKAHPPYDLVDLLRARGIPITKEIEKEIEKKEAKRIRYVIHGTSQKTYKHFIDLMDKIPSLREQFKKLGFESAKKYFDEKERWLNSLI
ncbi:hypothetical protein EXS72_01930 [Candidatus Pacearchaeota archaeon]|nr:hypothetical protein [Candidatus Pacearchaeota archaeon]